MILKQKKYRNCFVLTMFAHVACIKNTQKLHLLSFFYVFDYTVDLVTIKNV